MVMDKFPRLQDLFKYFLDDDIDRKDKIDTIKNLERKTSNMSKSSGGKTAKHSVVNLSSSTTNLSSSSAAATAKAKAKTKSRAKSTTRKIGPAWATKMYTLLMAEDVDGPSEDD